ncbi:uncharacterized mitochondrial protein AtMg00860-like [Rutidosis leptorrhynchoides]|uniref:uncharacterized mitochondrial protein AtMg00860-like n=1 Tax=Rutidosis leptorrhynchoides TaxID=125765 RepID=UPI003A99D9E5
MDEHVQHLRLVLQVIRQNTSYAKKSKCTFGTGRVEYLGHVISSEGVSTDLTKIEAMVQWPEPKNVKQLHSFDWNEEASKAFQILKQHVQQASVLSLPDFNKEFIVEMDASGVEIGAVLQQDGHPIAFMIMALSL